MTVLYGQIFVGKYWSHQSSGSSICLMKCWIQTWNQRVIFPHRKDYKFAELNLQNAQTSAPAEKYRFSFPSVFLAMVLPRYAHFMHGCSLQWRAEQCECTLSGLVSSTEHILHASVPLAPSLYFNCLHLSLQL